jgi:hypothetical protein
MLFDDCQPAVMASPVGTGTAEICRLYIVNRNKCGCRSFVISWLVKKQVGWWMCLQRTSGGKGRIFFVLSVGLLSLLPY